MTTTAIVVDWARFLGELSLSRTTPQFVANVEKVAEELFCVAPKFYLYHLTGTLLIDDEQNRVPVDEGSLAGRAALYCESVSEGGRVAVPVTHFGSLVGVLEAQSAPGALEELAPLVGLVYDAVRSQEEERSMLATTQELLVQATDRALPEGSGHVERVAQLATRIAGLIDLSEQSQQELWDAAYYHDLGCLPLQGKAFDVIRAQHAEVGARLLEASGALSHLAPLVASHHLRYSDTKNPERIPLEAWVLALAEDLDEFLTERRYQGWEESTREFYQERAPGHHPDVVDALSGLIDSGSLSAVYGAKE
jgi:hypothetical protein